MKLDFYVADLRFSPFFTTDTRFSITGVDIRSTSLMDFFFNLAFKVC